MTQKTGRSIGFSSGDTGLAFALIDVGRVLDEAGLIENGLDLIHSLWRAGDRSAELDIISGCAGAILALLVIHAEYQEPSVLDLAVRLGERLISAARNADTRRSHRLFAWGIRNRFGIAGALLELSYATHDARFRSVSEAAFDYEEQYYNPELENWPDLRIFDRLPQDAPRAPSYSTTWCHGAPGIGLARIRAYELTKEASRRREAESALRTTVSAVRQSAAENGSYALCHGIFGSAELPLRAATVFDDQSHGGFLVSDALVRPFAPGAHPGAGGAEPGASARQRATLR